MSDEKTFIQYMIVGSNAHGISADEAEQHITFAPAKDGDAGIDLFACFVGSMHVAPAHSTMVPCGIAVKVPDGHVGFIKGRSSTYRRHGLLVVDAVIDSGYTGPLHVTVYHPSLDGNEKVVVIRPWDRLAQLIIVPFAACQGIRRNELPSTQRGSDGFGSSGR